VLPSMPHGEIFGQLVVIDDVGHMVVIGVNKQWLSLMSIDVMGVFGEISKVRET
jgi:hypothetical protein